MTIFDGFFGINKERKKIKNRGRRQIVGISILYNFPVELFRLKSLGYFL